MSASRFRERVLSLCILISIASAPAADAASYVRGYLVNQVVLPLQRADYALDLNGDGKADNNFGNWLGALAGQGLDLQSLMNDAVASGSIVHIVGLHSADAFFANDPAAVADWYVGIPASAPPLFDGTDNLSIDSSVAPGTFLAALSSGSFTSPSPATTTTPVSLTLRLQLGGTPVSLPVQGAALSFTTVGTGNIQGRLNGSIRHTDFMALVPPFLAQSFTSQIQSDPTSNTAIQIKQIFDTGCTAGDGFQNDDVIELCEVTGSSLIQAVLAPDVQIRDADGNYAPNPLNTTRDANSFGVAFTAIVTDRVFANGFDH
jgi:hypothetical protein